MSIASSRRRELVVTGLVSLGLATSMAATATAATAAPAEPKAKAPSYVAEAMGPRAQAQPYPFGNIAAGISNAGEVLVRPSALPAFVTNGRAVRTLPQTVSASPYDVFAGVMTASGDVYGGGHDAIAKWTRTGVAGGVVAGRQRRSDGDPHRGGQQPGDVAGCVSIYRVGNPFIGSFPRKSVKQLTWPAGSFGNCSVTGISDRGVATVNQEAPSYRTDESYPRAATMTTSGVAYLSVAATNESVAMRLTPAKTCR